MDKNVYLLCNAHIDPVWLWEWKEGAAEAVSTFRTAADFCEEFDGFVFNHNESLLYEWVEEYEPQLFERIKKLVKKGNWNIMGGWYLQPDCTMLSGESFIRQIRYGRSYFAEKFGKEPKTAINLDPFGHTRGLVQILKKTGYDSYLFMRPAELGGDFIWRGFDGSEVVCHGICGGYGSLKGQAVEKLKYVLKEQKDKENLLVLWGMGDHGGGPSRMDWGALSSFIKEHSEINFIHSTTGKYFSAVKKERLNVFEKSLGPSMVGCYTSMVRIKQANRRVENKIELMKRMAAQANIDIDEKELAAAEKALMLSQFHDCLPGSMIKKSEEAILKEFAYAEKVCDKYCAKAFFKMCDGQKKGKSREIPIIVYNPMPYTVEKEIEVEFQLESQNWNEGEYTIGRVKTENGEFVPTQNEKEDCSISLDWRKKVVFRAELKPMSVNRFDCELETMQNYNRIAPFDENKDYISLENDRMNVKISKSTGLIDEYSVDGISRLKKSSALINVYKDNEDPWGMNVSGFNEKLGCFTLMENAEANEFLGYPEEKRENVRVIENGTVRLKIQALFKYDRSFASVTYTIPKRDAYIDMHIKILSNNVCKAYKLCFNEKSQSNKFVGQTAFGTEELLTDGKEVTFHNWCGIPEKDSGLFVINNGSYGGSFSDNTICQTLLRTPVYSAHPITPDRVIAPHDRLNEHIDIGEREFDVRLSTSAFTDAESESFNMPCFVLPFFPSGTGEKTGFNVELSNRNIILSTLQKQGDESYIVRLYNSKDAESQTDFIFSDNCEKITFNPFEIKTLIIKNGIISENNMFQK